MTERKQEPPEPGGRSRLEDEVLEILARTDRPASLSEHVRRKTKQSRPSRVGRGELNRSRLTSSIGPGSLLIGSVTAAILAAAVGGSSALLAQLLALLSVGLLIGVYVQRYGAPGRGNAKQWRGREIHLSSPSPAWVESLRDRFRRPPRR